MAMNGAQRISNISFPGLLTVVSQHKVTVHTLQL